MLKIGIDIDGTINNFNKLIYKYAECFNKSQGIDKKADMSDYYLSRFFGWSDYQDNEFWTQNLIIAMTNATPLPGAVQTISQLKNEGIEIYIITARIESYRKHTVEWLKEHNIGYDGLIMNRDKAHVCLKYGINVMIDDHPENCTSIAEFIPVLCMGYPYNSHLNGMENIRYINNWAEVYDEVMSLNREKQVV